MCSLRRWEWRRRAVAAIVCLARLTGPDISQTIIKMFPVVWLRSLRLAPGPLPVWRYLGRQKLPHGWQLQYHHTFAAGVQQHGSIGWQPSLLESCAVCWSLHGDFVVATGRFELLPSHVATRWACHNAEANET